MTMCKIRLCNNLGPALSATPKFWCSRRKDRAISDTAQTLGARAARYRGMSILFSQCGLERSLASSSYAAAATNVDIAHIARNAYQ